MSYIVTIDSESKQALALLEYMKTLSFVKIKATKKTAIGEPEILEEDEDGIPVKHKEFITELSKKN